jgi:hypothetical protein
MPFHEKDFEIPQACLDLGFEDRSCHEERSARLYNPELDLTLWVNEPSASKKRYVLVHCEHGTLGEVETDDELRELVASVRLYATLLGPSYAHCR